MNAKYILETALLISTSYMGREALMVRKGSGPPASLKPGPAAECSWENDLRFIQYLLHQLFVPVKQGSP